MAMFKRIASRKVSLYGRGSEVINIQWKQWYQMGKKKISWKQQESQNQ